MLLLLRWVLIIVCYWPVRQYKTTCWSSTPCCASLRRQYSDTNMSTTSSTPTLTSQIHLLLMVCVNCCLSFSSQDIVHCVVIILLYMCNSCSLLTLLLRTRHARVSHLCRWSFPPTDSRSGHDTWFWKSSVVHVVKVICPWPWSWPGGGLSFARPRSSLILVSLNMSVVVRVIIMRYWVHLYSTD